MKEEKTILCYGNSLTAGYGFTQEHSYPGVLQKLLNTNGYSYQVINAGVSGETTAGGLSRLPRYLDIKADIFILELGVNDGLRGMSVDNMKNNLEKIIIKVKEANPGVKLVLAGMQMPFNLQHASIIKFLKVYPDLAEKHKALLIPFFLKDVMGVRSLNLPDGLHPNKEGYQIIAKNVFDFLKPYLDEPQNYLP